VGIEVVLKEPVLGKVVDHRNGMTALEKAPDNIGSDEPTSTQRQNPGHASFLPEILQLLTFINLPYAHLPDLEIVNRQSNHNELSGGCPYKHWETIRAES
jgi:hypothetical protein